MKEKRIYYIDIAKAIGIISVVMGHIYGVGLVRHFLYSFHVPLFFFLSSLFLNFSKPLKGVIIEKIKTLLVPYFIVSLISICIYSVIGNYVANALGKNISEFSNNSIVSNIVGMLYANSRTGLMNWNRPLWFFPCLFSAILLLELVEKFLINGKKKIRFLVLVCTIVIGFSLSKLKIILPFHLECAINMLVWMELAIIVKKYILIENNKICSRKFVQHILVICVFVVGMVTSLLNEIVDVRINFYGNYFIYLVSACSFIFCVIWCSKAIGKNQFLEYIGRNTMVILLFHKFPILFFQSIFGPTKEYLRDLGSFSGTLCAVFVGAFSILSCLFLKEIYRLIKNRIISNSKEDDNAIIMDRLLGK